MGARFYILISFNVVFNLCYSDLIVLIFCTIIGTINCKLNTLIYMRNLSMYSIFDILILLISLMEGH